MKKHYRQCECRYFVSGTVKYESCNNNIYESPFNVRLRFNKPFIDLLSDPDVLRCFLNLSMQNKIKGDL